MNETKVYKNLIELFDEMAVQRPEGTAIICSGEYISYKQLYDNSIRVSSKLLDMEIKPNDMVGIMMQRTVDMVSLMVGILRAGATLLPIDRDYPEERIKYILSNSNCKLLITDKEEVDYDVKVLEPESMFAGEETAVKQKAYQQGLSLDNTAYVIYTSGSTGKPKGVMLSHHAIISFAKGISKVVELEVGMRMLAVATISFDLSIFEIIVSLMKGMTVVLAQGRTINSSRMLLQYIKDNKVDILQMTPSRMLLLMESSKDYSWLSGVSEIIHGGERFPERLLKLLKKHTKARIFNLYGPTETTIYCTGQEMTHKEKLAVGGPFEGTTVYIMDEEQNEVEHGVSGEIYIGGDQLAKGYISNPLLTDKSFFYKNERLYKSGDMGKIDEEGNLVILGRADDQVKIRGFRVETNEIAEVLVKYPKVKQAVVVPKKGKQDSIYLCAYYIADEEIGVQELRNHLKRFLAYYMIPDEYIRIDKFPETLNHKIDKKQLAIGKN